MNLEFLMHRPTSLLALLALLSACAQTQPAWRQALLAQVPGDACAVAVIEMPAHDLAKHLVAALPPSHLMVADHFLQRTKGFPDAASMLDELSAVLEDWFCIVVREAAACPSLPVVWPATIPQAAVIFRLRPGANAAPWQKAREALVKCGAFSHVYDFRPSAPKDDESITEFCMPRIPGTGEVVILISPHWVAFSNSSLLLKDLWRAELEDTRAFLANMDRAALGSPGTGCGSLIIRPQAVRAQVEQLWSATKPDLAWLAQHGVTDSLVVVQTVHTLTDEDEEMPEGLVTEGFSVEWEKIVSGDAASLRMLIQPLADVRLVQVKFEQTAVPLILARIFSD